MSNLRIKFKFIHVQMNDLEIFSGSYEESGIMSFDENISAAYATKFLSFDSFLFTWRILNSSGRK